MMELFTVHKCSGPKLKCFDCSRPICPSCLVTTNTALMCKQCVAGKNAKVVRKNASVAFADVAKLEAASVSFSAVAFSFLSMFSSCVT
jgi:hypothetical protein